MNTHPARIPVAKVILWGMAGLAAVLAVMRFIYGMGPVSNMNNAFGFGFWISFDLYCGVALAAGAFTVCAAVYVLNIKELAPLKRPAVLTGFLGYVMVIVALLIDLGRPERIWHMIVYWNPESPLFEVGLCVMTYTTVLLFEFIPLVFEKLHWNTAIKIMHSVTYPLIILGVVLSTLHQSTLGTMLLITHDKMHPLWWSPLLPLYFFISAISVGMGMTVVESAISSHAYGREMEVHLLAKLTKGIPWVLGLLLVLKLGYLAWVGKLGLLFHTDRYTLLYWAEMLFGTVLPIILFSIRKARESKPWLTFGGSVVVLGLILNRLDASLIVWNRPPGFHYFPSWMEFGVSFGIVAAGVLVYDWVARNLPLFADEHSEAEHKTAVGQ